MVAGRLGSGQEGSQPLFLRRGSEDGENGEGRRRSRCAAGGWFSVDMGASACLGIFRTATWAAKGLASPGADKLKLKEKGMVKESAMPVLPSLCGI